MAGQFLDGPCRSPSHRQVRTEGVPEHVDSTVLHLPPARRSPHPVLQRPTADGLALLLAQHQWAFQMPVLAERRGQPDGEGNVSEPSPLRRRDLTVPVGPLNA